MRHILFPIGLFAITLFVMTLSVPGRTQAQVLAFPEAEGFGRFATGARTNLSAATVYHVTNLNDSGAGSFRDAVSQSNRFVVFDVGGIANISSVVPVASNITIAGQTAPGGFTLYNDRISFTGSNNLISRHFAVRKSTVSGRTDTASIARGTNMIFDHMSVTWGVDSNFDINADNNYVVDDITIQNTIIAQGLDNVGHSTGQLVQPSAGGQISLIKNLYADNVTRNPKVKGENEFINNVVYGWESAAYIMGGDSEGTSHANVMGNYFIEGPINGSSPFSGGNELFHIYASDNWVDADRDGVLDGTFWDSSNPANYPGSDIVSTPFAFPTSASMTAQQAVEYVMENAGPHIVRNAVDASLMEEVASYGTLGGVIERDSHLFPGFATNPSYLNPRARLVDGDNDGIADNWESANGLSPTNSTDWKGLSGGYTRLEQYLNELGANGSTVSSTGGAWTTPATWTGGVPTLADDAVASGNLTHNSGHAFARRLTVDGSLSVNGGTLDVFDTASINDSSTISGSTVMAGQLMIGSPGQAVSLTVQSGATLRTGTIGSNGGTPSLVLDGGTFQAGGAPDIKIATTLGAAGGTIDTAGYSGAISGAISGTGGLTKQGAGSLTLSGVKSYSGPTVIEEGEIIVQGSGLSQTSAIELGSGTTLNYSAVSGGLSLSAGKSIGGSGTVVGNVVAGAGSVVRPEGTGGMSETIPGTVGIQAEDLTLGSDWAIFDNGVHGTGAGGSYNGADLSGGGIVLVASESLAAPSASGIATTTVAIPETKTWYLFAKVAEPTTSPIAGDPSTQPGGNNSFFTSVLSGTVQATTSNFDIVQTFANPGNAATWNRVSPSLSSLAGVNSPLDAGIDYFLSNGLKNFTIYGREVGTIIDGFVLSDRNLTADELEEVLSGPDHLGFTVEGDFMLSAGALLEVEVAGGDILNSLSVSGTATLGGDLSISLADGFVPQASDEFLVVDAGALVGQFGNAAVGLRVPTADRNGSFAVNYDFTQDTVSLSSFAAAIPGDFNFDLTVDDDDLTWWRDNHGGLANGADFLLWQQNYGAGAASTVATPEPSAAVLLAFAAGISAVGRRR